MILNAKLQSNKTNWANMGNTKADYFNIRKSEIFVGFTLKSTNYLFQFQATTYSY